MKAWILYCQQHHTKSTCQTYIGIIRRFHKFIGPNGSLTTADIEKYLTHILQFCTNRTANCNLTAIRSYCRYYFGNPNPAKSIHFLKEVSPKQRCLSDNEYRLVLAVAKPKDRDVLQFFANTALRRAEFLDLPQAIIEPKKRFMTIIGKGKKTRTIPLNDAARKILVKNASLQFVCRFKWPCYLNRLCIKLAKKANIPPFGPHALRHLAATRLIQAGVPLIKVSKILGHSSTQITEKIYVHLVPQDLIGVTDVLVD